MYTQHGWAANGLTTTGRQTFLLFFSEGHAEALSFTAGDFRRSEGRESRRFRICQATRTNCKSHDNSCRSLHSFGLSVQCWVRFYWTIYLRGKFKGLLQRAAWHMKNGLEKTSHTLRLLTCTTHITKIYKLVPWERKDAWFLLISLSKSRWRGIPREIISTTLLL